MATPRRLWQDQGDHWSLPWLHPPGSKTNQCPFCDGDLFSGSWSPDKCRTCGAVYFFDSWTLEKPARPRTRKLERGEENWRKRVIKGPVVMLPVSSIWRKIKQLFREKR